MNKNHALRKKHRFTNVRQLVEWSAETYGNKTAYSFRIPASSAEATTISFIELRNKVRALASEMLSMGCAGKHCALIGKFSHEWAITYFAALSIGAVLVPLDKDWLADDLADTVSKANASFLFGDEDIADKIASIADKVSLDAEPVMLLAKTSENSLAKLIEAGEEKFEADPDAYFEAPINPMKMSLLVFTSGTTGKGKGVMLSQNAILSDMYNVVPYIDFADKTIGVLPPHHTYGSTVMLIGHMSIGCEVYISSGIRYITKELKAEKPRHLILVPLYLETFYRKIIANLKEQKKYDLVFKMIKVSNALRKVGVDNRRKMFSAIHAAFGGEVKMIISGGAPLSPDILYFYDGIGIDILNGYGITECAPLISVNRSKHNVLGSIGQPIDDVEVRIDDPNEDGEGEILVKGPNVMLGYYNNEEATADAFKDGYFRTGDYGKITRDGVIYITGRKKNLIILSNGKNVYPEEIESELIALPGVLDVVVYEGQSRRGVTHNTVVAEIYPDKDYFEKEGVENIKCFFKPYVDNYNRNAVPYKKIGVLKVREDEFPKNTLRKIQRFKIDMTID